MGGAYRALSLEVRDRSVSLRTLRKVDLKLDICRRLSIDDPRHNEPMLTRCGGGEAVGILRVDNHNVNASVLVCVEACARKVDAPVIHCGAGPLSQSVSVLGRSGLSCAASIKMSSPVSHEAVAPRDAYGSP